MNTFDDYLRAARRRLPHFLFEYLDGGAYGEETLRANRSSLAEVSLRQRVLRNVAGVDSGAAIFGVRHALPIVLGPVGLAGMMARRGEASGARAAQRIGIPYCMSNYAICSLAEVASATSEPFWLQLNVFKDRGFMAAKMREAEGRCSALVLTVDQPQLGTRYRDFKTGMYSPPGFRTQLRRYLQSARKPSWAWNVGLHGRPHVFGNIQNYMDQQGVTDDPTSWTMGNLDPAADWDVVKWVRETWKGPLTIKGILDPEDAVTAVELGADAIVVSNHGGRQLDGALATARALPPIADRVAGRCRIFVDGGVRSGIDVLKMLTLGADSVFLGRAWVVALAANGEQGVVDLVQTMGREIRSAMAMMGARTLDEIERSSPRTPLGRGDAEPSAPRTSRNRP